MTCDPAFPLQRVCTKVMKTTCQKYHVLMYSMRFSGAVTIAKMLKLPKYSSKEQQRNCNTIHTYYVQNTLDLWVSTFLILQLLNTVSHVVVNPNHKIISLLLHNCNFAAIINNNVTISYAGYLICSP